MYRPGCVEKLLKLHTQLQEYSSVQWPEAIESSTQLIVIWKEKGLVQTDAKRWRQEQGWGIAFHSCEWEGTTEKSLLLSDNLPPLKGTGNMIDAVSSVLQNFSQNTDRSCIICIYYECWHQTYSRALGLNSHWLPKKPLDKDALWTPPHTTQSWRGFYYTFRYMELSGAWTHLSIILCKLW